MLIANVSNKQNNRHVESSIMAIGVLGVGAHCPGLDVSTLWQSIKAAIEIRVLSKQFTYHMCR